MRCAPKLAGLALIAALLSACPLPDYRYPPGPPEIDSFTAIPFDIAPGGSTEVVWTTRGADRVTLLGEAVATAGSKQLSFTATTSVELIAENEGGTSRARVEVRVIDPRPVAILVYAASPPRASPGEVVTLNWRTEHATRVSLSFSTGEVLMRDADPVGSVSIRSDVDFTVELRAEGFQGPKIESRSVHVEPRAPAIDSFFVDPQIVTPPATPYVVWEGRYTDRLLITEHFDSGDEALLYQGPTSFGAERLPLSTAGGSRTIRVVATGPGGEVTESTRLLVLDPRPPEITELTVSPSENGPGGTSLVRWSTRFADGVALNLGGNFFTVDAQGALWMPFERSQEIELTASSAFSSVVASRTAVIDIDPARPAIELFVSPATAEVGREAIISWNTERADHIRFVTDAGEEIFSSTAPVGDFVYVAPAPLIALAIAQNQAGATVRTVPISFVAPPQILEFFGPEVARVDRPAEYSWRTEGAFQGTLGSRDFSPSIREDIDQGSRWVSFSQAIDAEVRLSINSSVVYNVSSTIAVSVLPANYSTISIEPDDAISTSNGPHLISDFGEMLLSGDLEAGDTDMFAFFIPENGRIYAELSGLDACSIPAAIDVYEEDLVRGVVGLVSSFVDVSCETVDARIDPAVAGMGGVAILAVRADSFDPRSDSYVLRVLFNIKSCGDGIRDRGEACDDGNNVPGDGCSACNLEALDEVEFNNEPDYASPLQLGAPFRAYLGDGDRDFFRFVIPPDRAGPVRVALGTHLEPNCPRVQLSVFVELDNPITLEAESGCAELGGPELVLEPGTYVLSVSPGAGLSRDVRGTYTLLVDAL